MVKIKSGWCKMGAKNSIFGILAAVLILFSFSCGRPETGTKKLVIGKWVIPGAEDMMEYFEDGTAVIVDNRGVEKKAAYEILSGNEVRVSFTGYRMAKRFKIESSESNLTMAEVGSAIAYQKAEEKETVKPKEASKVSLKERYKEMEAKAEAGDPYYQGVFAGVYQRGKGVYFGPIREREKRALELATLSAEQGNPMGQYNLAVLKIFSNDNEEAKVLLEKCAYKIRVMAEDDNDVYAQCFMGEMHEKGWWFPQDWTKARMYYRYAAEQGNATGQYEMGNHIKCGDSKEAWMEKAEWYKKAADQGHEDARAQHRMCLGHIKTFFGDKEAGN
ncbi:tetratricopeptide repeat protein [Candidatus Omnitrophota bacterium]